ncbi:MAG: tyrosine-type recombinase/integrase [Candidatus Sulfotelmatobacter sp.]
MSLYKRGSTWWSRIEHNRTIHQQSLRTKNKNTAIELEAALKTSLVTGQHQVAKNCPTLKEFETRLFDHLRIHVKPRSLQFYKEQYAVLKRSLLGNLRLSLIDSAACDAFKQWRHSQGPESLFDERGVIAEFIKNLNPNDLLFPDMDGGMLTRWQVTSLIEKYGSLAGVPEHKRFIHSLKHTAGIHMRQAGCKLEEIKAALGHKSMNSTAQYLRVSADEADDARARAFWHER